MAEFLTDLGGMVIDTDRIAHEITEPGSESLEAIRDAFGERVFNQDGSLNRGAVADIVFNDEKQLQVLNSILHPKIGAVWKNLVEECGHPFVFVVIPLLYEVELQDNFDEVWVVTADDEIRINRVMKRDNASLESIMRRILNQMPEAKKIEAADLVINTNGNLESTRSQTEKAFSNLLKKLNRGE